MMSGTSLDGVDLVLARFMEEEGRWSWDIEKAETRPYTLSWRDRLREAIHLEGRGLIHLHIEYGRYLGDLVRAFLKEEEPPLAVVSHGHTLFHRPDEGYTFQLGEGQTLAVTSGLPVVYDLRTADVAAGGEGAPLVPVGDRHLFRDYALCLNLGGFANISYEEKGRRIAYDLSPANLAMQHVTRPLGKDYDEDGRMGAQGKVDQTLLEALNTLEYYHLPPPRSLGTEWLETRFFPVLDRFRIRPEDKLRTLYEHIAFQIVRQTSAVPPGRMLVTGGGAHNLFLVGLLREKYPGEVVVPDKMIVDFKEALIFAFLGLLRLLSRPNTLASVTGARFDSVAGTLADPYGRLQLFLT